ncbi:hypothetical protein E2562_008795 [Oryza meyeriana var. granulata]|uniref:NB-ARC domain-containing protein n=1 Tax=Oryza meyeriana var. granulata TaxID=110450 RepID=A0A6G1D073_9ORYZ|nr:hypothetical protein E2562_008795 [Oryza meyeriana var. granulata]
MPLSQQQSAVLLRAAQPRESVQRARDAENKRTNQLEVSTWLKHLKKFSYEAIDVFDEFKYEALWREAKKNGQDIMIGKGAWRWRHSDSIMVDFEKDIVSRSRDEEKKKIIKLLLDDANGKDLTVLPVFGMPGLGKTTFIQLIYNDPEIKNYFQIRRWICRKK